MELSPSWEFVSDGVMGGVSQGGLRREVLDGREAARLTGRVSLENDGGFLQMAFDLAEGGAFDASAWRGVELDLRGDGETYELRVKTDRLTRPWQSFRAAFEAPGAWTSRRFAFADLEPYRTEAVFDASGLRRMGVLAVGRAFEADVAVAGARLFR